MLRIAGKPEALESTCPNCQAAAVELRSNDWNGVLVAELIWCENGHIIHVDHEGSTELHPGVAS